MKRFLLALIAFSLCAGMLVYTLPVEAGKTYSNTDLDGTYYFVTTEVRDGDQPNSIEHCSTYGTVNFDGAGIAYTNENFRCHDDSSSSSVETGTRSTTFDYSVSSDGSFTMTNPDGETTHCQILNRGSLVLCDGTAADASDPLRSFLAIATEL